jgi:hypothetical protein
LWFTGPILNNADAINALFHGRKVIQSRLFRTPSLTGFDSDTFDVAPAGRTPRGQPESKNKKSKKEDRWLNLSSI